MDRQENQEFSWRFCFASKKIMDFLGGWEPRKY